MKKKLTVIIPPLILFLFILGISLVPAYATPPSTPHIGSGSAADGGSYFEFNAAYLGESGWRDLKTPPHWVVETGEIAYCLDHKSESPDGDSYNAFNPAAIYSERTLTGLTAILEHSFPYRNAGLTDNQIRYSTANAIRAWLRESAGIGYDFMLPSNNAVRPKNSAGQGPYNFYLQLLDKARNGSIIVHSVTTNPSTIEMEVHGDKLIGQTVIKLNALNGGYTINSSAIPSGITITGYTGQDGDVLTFSVPISKLGEEITMNSLFQGKDNRTPANLYWLSSNGGLQPVVVPVVDTMQVVTTGSITLISTLPDIGHIEIYNKDSDTNANLAGAIFQILDSNNQEVDRLTTNSSGYDKSIDLPSGAYSLKEITAPNGYVIDTTVHENIIVTKQETITVNLTNIKPTGRIRIHMQNASPEIGDYSLMEAVFEIRNSCNTLVDTITTNSIGLAVSRNLPLGEYTVKVETVPYGYVLNEETFNTTLEYEGQTIPVVYDDVTVLEQPQVGKIKIQKINSDVSMGDYPLDGAVFEIRDDENNLVEIITTEETGNAISKSLPLGDYTVKETEAPIGYVLNSNTFNAKLEYSNQTVSVIYDEITVPNAPQRGTITITKQDSETGSIPQGDAILDGAVYEIYDENDSLIQRLESLGAEITSKELPLGKYKINEVEPPIGYLLDKTEYLVNIEYSNHSIAVNKYEVIVAYDIKKGQISINKTAEMVLVNQETNDSNPPIEGVKFEIRLKSSNELIDTLTTDADGNTESIMLPYGTYIITEANTPTAYIPCEPFEVMIDENSKVYEYSIENKVHKSKVKIIKIDGTTGNIIPIAGTEFKIKDSAGDFITQQDSDVFLTDETGTILLPEPLIYGDFTLHEIKAPYGYWLNETPVSFSITENSNELVTIEFENTLIEKQIQILKVDDKNNQRPLADAVFEVRNSHNKLIKTITTDDNGIAVTSMLTVGDYTITEIKAPIGFVLDDLVFQQTISDDITMIYSIRAESTPTEVIITQTDITDDNPLSNAHIQIFNVEEELVYEGNTNENGELIIKELPVGTYTFKETIAPEGYILNTTVFEFTIIEDGSIVGTTNIQNIPTKVILSKIDLINGEPVADAEIEIFNAEKESVFKDKTDINGEIVITHLPVGIYTFIETKAPDGYIISKEVIEFTIDEYGVITGEISMSNCPTVLNICKVKYEDNTPLTGAGFKIKNWLGLNTLSFTKSDDGIYRFDKDGDIMEILVDENGETVVYGLPLGNYWLEESIVPAGYYPAAPVKITIDETTDIDIPYEVIIPNSVFVKLGLDRDKYNVPIVIGLALVTLALLVFFFIRRKRRQERRG